MRRRAKRGKAETPPSRKNGTGGDSNQPRVIKDTLKEPMGELPAAGKAEGAGDEGHKEVSREGTVAMDTTPGTQGPPQQQTKDQAEMEVSGDEAESELQKKLEALTISDKDIAFQEIMEAEIMEHFDMIQIQGALRESEIKVVPRSHIKGTTDLNAWMKQTRLRTQLGGQMASVRLRPRRRRTTRHQRGQPTSEASQASPRHRSTGGLEPGRKSSGRSHHREDKRSRGVLHKKRWQQRQTG